MMVSKSDSILFSILFFSATLLNSSFPTRTENEEGRGKGCCRGLEVMGGSGAPERGSYSKVTAEDLARFRELLGAEGVLTAEGGARNLELYTHDWTGRFKTLTGGNVVLKPTTTEQVSAVLKHCNERRLVGTRCSLPSAPRACVNTCMPVSACVHACIKIINRSVSPRLCPLRSRRLCLKVIAHHYLRVPPTPK